MKKLSLLLSLPIAFSAVSKAEDVTFEKDILPIWKERCMECHRAAYTDAKTGRLKKPKGDYRLDKPDLAVKSGESEKPAIVPGKSGESHAIALISLPADDDDIMPPKGDPLTAEQIEAFKKWIDAGANFGEWKGEPEDAAPAP
jgi:hypothetical protein